MRASANGGNTIGRRMRVCASTCLLLGLLQGVTACARGGQVIDEDTGKPLEGVFVMAIWNAYVPGIVGPYSRCYAFEITRTDQNGHYRLPQFSWDFSPMLWERHRYQDYYLAGYEEAPNNDTGAHVWKMRRFTGSVESRLKNMGALDNHISCLPEADWKVKLAPLYRVQAEEARKLAVTPREKELARAFEFVAVEVEVGHEKHGEILTRNPGK